MPPKYENAAMRWLERAAREKARRGPSISRRSRRASRSASSRRGTELTPTFSDDRNRFSQKQLTVSPGASRAATVVTDHENRPWSSLPVRLVMLGVLAVTVSFLVAAWKGSATPSLADATAGASPGQITKASRTIHRFEYVVVDGAIDVYDVARAHRLVQRIGPPQVDIPHGAAAHPASGMLYVSYERGESGNGSILAYDLLRGRLVWQREYDHGVDSIAILPNGKTLYAPAGESSGDGQGSSHLGRARVWLRRKASISGGQRGSSMSRTDGHADRDADRDNGYGVTQNGDRSHCPEEPSEPERGGGDVKHDGQAH